MKLIILTLVLAQLGGCAAYGIASTASYVVTDKTLADHVATQAVPYSNCATNNLFQGLYYCEIQDPSKTYNRSAF